MIILSYPSEWPYCSDEDKVIKSQITKLKYEVNRDCIVAVIDGCVKQEKSIWKNKKERIDGIDNDKNGYIDDVNGWNFNTNTNDVFTKQQVHGSQIITCINSVCTINNIKILPLVVLNNKNKGNIRDIINAITYAETQGAQICNLSVGTAVYDDRLQNCIKHSKMLFVVAAGNFGLNLDKKNNFWFPVSFNLENVISVASINKKNELCSFSNYGKKTVDVAAPGEDLKYCFNGKTQILSGTSFSAAYITGIAAVIYIVSDTKLHSYELKKYLLSTIVKSDKINVKSGGFISFKKTLKDLKDKKWGANILKKSNKLNKLLLIFTLLGVIFISLFIVCVVISLNNTSSHEILGIDALLLEFVLFITAIIFFTIANILSVMYWKRKGNSIGIRQAHKNIRKMFRGEK